MKKALFLFLLSLLTIWAPCGFAATRPIEISVDSELQNDTSLSDGSVGSTAAPTIRETGGGIVGNCDEEDYKPYKNKPDVIHFDAISEHGRCDERLRKKGIVSTYATCEKNNSVGSLSCTTYECDKEGYVLHRGYGYCETIKDAEAFCKRQFDLGRLSDLRCDSGDIPVPQIGKNTIKNRKGLEYKKCGCPNRNGVVYDCNDDGKGTPPTDDGNYTNLDKITIKSAETCNKIGHHFTGWRCNSAIMQPGDEINDVRKKLKCTAQWEKNEYNLEYKCDEGSDAIKTETKLYNDTVNVPGYNAACKKDGNIFTNWKCGSTTYDANQTFKITGDTICIAQWKSCEQCNAVEGCICELYVENNICKYRTTPQEGYYVKSGENSANPQCILASEKECIDSEGQWIDGICKCKPDVPGTYWDIQKGTCECTDINKEYKDGQCISKCNAEVADPDENGGCKCKDPDKIYNAGVCECPPEKPKNDEGQCVEPTKCPPEAPGDNYPDGCMCIDTSRYFDKDRGCLPKCNEEIATWNGNECVCKEGTKEYHKNTSNISLSTCECKEGEREYDDNPGKCETLRACPEDADGTYPDCECKDEDMKYDPVKNKCVVDELKRKQKAYDEAKATEQSKENRTLTALTTAATGIGGMELAMGLAQQAADAYADQSMAAYLATMRCTYGNDKQVKAGPDEIELPGGNSSELMSLRSEYFALAKDLKERKEALGMKPGIESEEIIDKAQTGLYDDENLGIDSGAYASLYRAQMLGSETDQTKIDEERKASKNRVIAGGVLVGAGVVGGIVGNSLINGKLGEKIRENKARRKAETVSALDTKEEIKRLSKEAKEKYESRYETE